MADAWDTSNMSNALPGHADSEANPGGSQPEQPQGAAAENWAQPVAYDYKNFGDAEREWAGNAAVYEFQGDEGDIGPAFPALELQIFGDPENRQPQGIDFSKIAEIELVQDGPTRIKPIFTFGDAGLHPAMMNNVELAGYRVPTPIQQYCIPAIKEGYDVIAIAQTGSGKTAAYLIPILDKLMGKAKKLAAPRPNPAIHNPAVDGPIRAEPLVVVVCPTRELAVQIFNEARKFCYRSMLRPCVCYGGGPISEQIMQLRKGCDVLIASPGRLIDFMDRPEILTLKRLKYMVIDEADEMLQADWQEDFEKIMTGGEQDEGNVKFMLFSATFPKATRDLAREHLAATHVRFRVGRAGSTHENIEQHVVFVSPEQKKQALMDLLKSLPPCRTIIFVNSKRMADEIDDFLYNLGMPCTSMHADRTQREREDAMRAFRSGQMPILIATGVTARGIDVRNVLHVINYDLPSMDHGGIEEYTHRIGRTGRIGHRGRATSFYSERDEPIASVLTRTLMETGQTVPDFLEGFMPPKDITKENLKFEADSDWDENEAAMMGESGAGGGGWGGGDDTAAGDGWGSGGGDAGWGASSASDAKENDVQGAEAGWGSGASIGDTHAPFVDEKQPGPDAQGPPPAGRDAWSGNDW